MTFPILYALLKKKLGGGGGGAGGGNAMQLVKGDSVNEVAFFDGNGQVTNETQPFRLKLNYYSIHKKDGSTNSIAQFNGGGDITGTDITYEQLIQLINNGTAQTPVLLASQATLPGNNTPSQLDISHPNTPLNAGDIIRVTLRFGVNQEVGRDSYAIRRADMNASFVYQGINTNHFVNGFVNGGISGQIYGILRWSTSTQMRLVILSNLNYSNAGNTLAGNAVTATENWDTGTYGGVPAYFSLQIHKG